MRPFWDWVIEIRDAAILSLLNRFINKRSKVFVAVAVHSESFHKSINSGPCVAMTKNPQIYANTRST